MLKKGRLAFASTLIVLLVMLLAACGGGEPPPTNTGQQTYNYQTPSNTGGTLIYSDWQFPASLNPWFATGVVDVELISATWGAPITITSDAKIAPDQLTEVPSPQNGDVSADGLSVTMKLRHDLKWSDGQPLTSADFIYYIKTLLDPATGAASTAGFDAETLASYTAPDPYTVVLKYVRPFSSYLFFLPFAAPEHAWGSIANKDLINTQDVNVAPRVTSGPFMVSDFASNQSYTLVPNPNYKSTTLHPTVLEKLVFKGYQSKDALIAGYQAAETDHAEDFTPGDLQKLNGLPGLQVTPAIFTEHLDFNLQNPVLQDVNVRKAIAKAINRCQIIEGLLHKQCSELSTNSLTPPPSPFYDPSTPGYDFSLDAAKADMQAAGWDCSSSPCKKNGQAFPTLRLVTTSGNPLRADTVQLIKDNLAALGIPVTVDGQLYPNAALFSDFASGGILATGKYDLAEFAYSYPLDGYGSLVYFQSNQIPTEQNPAGLNYERVDDPKIDQYFEQALAEVDFTKNANIYKQLLKYVAEQMYELPLYIRPNITLTDNKVGNYFPNPTSAGNEWNIGDWYVRTAS